jgi:hypothetical protein
LEVIVYEFQFGGTVYDGQGVIGRGVGDGMHVGVGVDANDTAQKKSIENKIKETRETILIFIFFLLEGIVTRIVEKKQHTSSI